MSSGFEARNEVGTDYPKGPRKWSLSSGTPAFADRPPVVDLTKEVQKSMTDSPEEMLAAQLSGKRKVDTHSGWNCLEADAMMESEDRHLYFCKDARRAKCVLLKSCINRESEGPMVEKALRRGETPLTPEQWFLKCRKVTIQTVRTLQEDWQ